MQPYNFNPNDIDDLMSYAKHVKKDAEVMISVAYKIRLAIDEMREYPFKIFELRKFYITGNGCGSDERVGFFSTREKAEAEAVKLGIDPKDPYSGKINEEYVR